MKRLLPVASVALAFASPAPATWAATQLGEHFSFSGFGTLGAVRTNSDEGKFGRDRQLGGADKKASLEVDSNLGLQLTGTATPWLSGTVQMLAAKRDKDNIEADVEWAFITLKPLDGLSLRGGRMTAPLFAISDSRNIGYANTWVRAPNEVYGLNVLGSLEGLDITYRKSLGPVAISTTGFAGKTKFKALGLDSTGDRFRGVNLQLETDWATFRLGQANTDVSIPAAGFFDAPYKFVGAGVTVDYNDIVAQAEWVRRESATNPSVVNSDGWYAMGGYRFGTVLPYFIVSSTKPKDLSAPFVTSATQKTTALGVRWDAFRSAALKLQLDRIDTDNSKGISFTTPSTPPPFPGAPPGTAPVTKPVTALSIAVDFTF